MRTNFKDGSKVCRGGKDGRKQKGKVNSERKETFRREKKRKREREREREIERGGGERENPLSSKQY